jgi:pyrimidine operon attenuation protein/uracil phosphoribosyltransferase
MPDEPVIILDEVAITRALRRIAHEIIEQSEQPAKELILAGIPARGAALARRLANLIGEIEGSKPEAGSLDISMHRDDLHRRPLPPKVHATELPLHLDGRTVILVDDVIHTGRTIRAAMDALTSFGRPACIRLAVLIDRGHREVPIRPDYVGKNLPTSRSERVMVRLADVDGEGDWVRLKKGN